MRRALILVSVAALALAASGSASIGWYAKWRGSAPITIKVNTAGLAGYPDQIPSVEAALADWSLSPAVDMVEASKGSKVSIDTNMAACGSGSYSCSVPNYSNGVLHSVSVHISPGLNFPLGSSWVQTVFCHELGHALGLGEGYPLSATGDYGSCMAGDSPHPSQMDYDELAVMYP